MSNGDARLGELLLRSQLISHAQLERARTEQKKSGGKSLSGQLAKLGYLDESEITNFLSKQFGVPSVNLDDLEEVSQEILDLIPKEVAERHTCLPINRAGSSLIVAMVDPMNIYAIDDLKFLTGYNIEVVVAGEQAIRDAINRYYESEPDYDYDEFFDGFDADDISFGDDDDSLDVSDLQNAAEEAPVVRLVNAILLDAIRKKASDIHIEPYERNFRVRYRIDGVLHEVMTPPLKLKNAITSRIKIMSNLDIAERRLPQDGRIKLRIGRGKEMDFRVSVLPCLFGEKVVMRLLDKSNLELDMTKLGFEVDPLALFQEAIHRPYGMVLVTGPTGSGKTTTLYSALSELNKVTENISTAEDPVEFNLRGINQVQISDSIGLNFASALRSFLRQDPDIIMVGEIRDFETAEISVKAALTGHMVLSTLHTNDAPGTVSRLLNMGIEPFLVASSVNLILAQRLARRLCAECKEVDDVSVEGLRKLQVPEEMIGSTQIYQAKGCKNCSDTGYRGRIALYEVFALTDEIKQYVLQGYSTAELKSEAIRLGMKTLRQSGISKVYDGVTTVKEITRVTAPD